MHDKIPKKAAKNLPNHDHYNNTQSQPMINQEMKKKKMKH